LVEISSYSIKVIPTISVFLPSNIHHHVKINDIHWIVWISKDKADLQHEIIWDTSSNSF